MQSLLERFGIDIPSGFDDYNLIGIDFGDGEISAARIAWEATAKATKLNGLALAPNGTLLKNSNAFFIGPSITQMVYSVRSTEEDEGFRYYNFKKCPGDPSIDQPYLLDDKTPAPLTYRQVMSQSFTCLVNILFEFNPYLLDKEKPTILLVGRPSSVGWQRSGQEYAYLLREGLELPEGQAPVYVAVEAESTAALAREIDPRWDRQRIQRGETVIVLDNGSSTFDITVITPNGIGYEDSFQFGGNQLDENLMSLLMESINKDKPGCMLKTQHGHKLGLREKKELFYGLDGNDRLTQVYNALLAGDELYEFFIRADVMEKAVSQMPAKVFHYGMSMDGHAVLEMPHVYPSWIDACRAVYQGFYEKITELGLLKRKGGSGQPAFVPDRVILSGGVSVMPEVRKVVREVFGIEPDDSARPNYAVSEGLAYVLETEIKKRQLLDKICSELDSILPSAGSLKTAIGDAGEDEEWEAFKNAVEDWKNRKGTSSIDDLQELWEKKYFNKSLELSIQGGAKRWFKDQDINQLISKYLNDTFDALFPSYAGKFNYQPKTISFSSLEGVNVSISWNCVVCFNNAEAADKTALRDEAWREAAWRELVKPETEKIIRTGGSVSFTKIVPIEKGLFHKRIVNEPRTVKYTYSGIRSMYLNDKAVTDEVAQKTRGDIIKLLHDPLKDYVEMITPYFNMTARRDEASEDDSLGSV